VTLQERASRIRLVIMDVDGTLTDGAMYYGPQGEALKRFSTRDGMGITLLHRAEITTAIITSEDTPIVTTRAAKLRVPHVYLGSHDKTATFQELSRQLSLSPESIAYIGDDVNDYHVMGLCGFAACPSDAVEAIKQRAHYIATAAGGNGAVREIAEIILQAQGKPCTLPEQW
jgi:3-deoxy-D-manno-octulosonate 8-phosphate phosphatase (KDO 8-P phosphatase)